MQAEDPRVAASLSGGVLRPDGADLVLAEWRDPGGGTDPPTYIAPLHVHRSDGEGRRSRLREDTVEATTAGAVAALVEAIHSRETRDKDALNKVSQDHDSELLGWR